MNYAWTQNQLADMMDKLEGCRRDSASKEWDFDFGKEGEQCKGCGFVAAHVALNFSDKLAKGDDDGGNNE